jgi:hypothetical protein
VDILKDAFALYKKHARVFVITAAVLFLPGSIISGAALTLITAPLTSGVTASLERTAARMERFNQKMAAGTATPEDIAEMTRASAEVPAVATAALGGIMAMLLTALGWMVVAFIIYGIVVPLTQGALTVAVADRAIGGRATWREHWGLLFRRVGKLIATLLPAAILIAIGIFCFVIPGLVLGFLFVFSSTVVLIEGTSGVAALKRSMALVKSDWLRVLLVLIAFGLINMVAHWIVALLPLGSVFLSHVVSSLLTLVLMPIPVLGLVLVYLDVRRKADGFTMDELRTELQTLRTE